MITLFYDDVLEGRSLSEPASLFLAGPTARGVLRTPWRAEALAWLERRGFAGSVLLPEFRDSRFDDSAPKVFGRGRSPVPNMKVTTYNILAWETAGLERSTVALFWMPFHVAAEEDPASLPGFTTRAEVSRELVRAPGRIVLGMPTGAVSGGHIRYHAHHAGLPIHTTLEATLEAALLRLGHRG